MGATKTERVAVKGLLVPTSAFKIADVVIIGRNNDCAFHDLLLSLRQDSRMRVVAEFQSLSAALQAGLGQTLAADFVVVLQSYTDEYAPDQIHEFIGRLLFARIMVCYGSWCTADGRSHELWPVAFRIPVASAAALIELELVGFLTEDQPLFPMSAGEEVFAHRSVFPEVSGSAVHLRVIVISNDFQIRSTVTGILDVLGSESTSLPMVGSSVRSYLNSQHGDFDFAIIDLEGPAIEVGACLALLATESQVKSVSGMSVFAASLNRDCIFSTGNFEKLAVSQIVEKTELLLQLTRLLKC